MYVNVAVLKETKPNEAAGCPGRPHVVAKLMKLGGQAADAVRCGRGDQALTDTAYQQCCVFVDNRHCDGCRSADVVLVRAAAAALDVVDAMQSGRDPGVLRLRRQ